MSQLHLAALQENFALNRTLSTFALAEHFVITEHNVLREHSAFTEHFVLTEPFVLKEHFSLTKHFALLEQNLYWTWIHKKSEDTFYAWNLQKME